LKNQSSDSARSGSESDSQNTESAVIPSKQDLCYSLH